MRVFHNLSQTAMQTFIHTATRGTLHEGNANLHAVSVPDGVFQFNNHFWSSLLSF